MQRFVTWALLLLGTLALQGCATFPVVRAKSPIEQPPAAGDGLVVVSVTNNTGQITQFDRIVLTRDQDKEQEKAQKFITYELRQVSRGIARDTAVFFASLPPGDYRFKQFWDDDRMLYLQLPPGGIEMLGSFNVTPGKVSDLGRLVATSATFNNMLVGRSALSGSNEEMLKRFVPQAASFYREGGDIVQGWSQPRPAVDKVEEFALAHPVGGGSLVELRGGDIAIASRIGSLLIRNSEGKWRSARTGRLESLLWIEPVDDPDALLVACGELNTLERLRKDASVEKLDAGDLPPGNLIFITGSEAKGWFVGHQQGETITLRSSPTLSKPQWTVVATERLPTSFWTGARQAWFFRTSSGFGYATSKGGFRFYDTASATWRNAAAPVDSTLGYVDVGAGDSIGVLTQPGGLGGVFAAAYLSRDGAKTWEKVEPQLKVKAGAPKLTADGTILFVSNEFGWSTFKPTLQASKDGGKTWTIVNDQLGFGTALWPLKSGSLISISSGQDGITTIRHSTDGGATWKTEYSSYTRL